MKNTNNRPKRIQFEATPELIDAIDDLSEKLNVTTSFVCRVGLMLFMQERNFIKTDSGTLEKFITPVAKGWRTSVKTKKGERK